MRKILACLLLVMLTAGVAMIIWLWPTTPPPAAGTPIPLTALLQGTHEGFAQVDAPWRFNFPRDHGAHPDYRTESWYFTGHLITSQGRRFGFQLTFFRLALAPESPAIDSAWATNQVYRSHFAVTDVNQGQFKALERFNRAALGLSGAETNPVRVWLENWSMAIPDTDETDRFQLNATNGEISLNLQLHNRKPLVLIGNDSGQTSIIPGGAFYGYLATRLAAEGTLQMGGKQYGVEGSAWLDRAWGEVPLSQGQIALNRFTLQLSDGREILCLQLRRRDGSRAPVTTGLVIQKDGSTRGLNRRDISLEALDHWESPDGQVRYPAHWQLRIPSEALDLEIIPTVADQEMHLSMRYWGGSVDLRGQGGGQPLTGQGHVELTGYVNANPLHPR